MTTPTPIGVPSGLGGLAAHDPGAIDDLRTLRESLEARSPLDERTTELIRIGTLIAVGAPVESFTAHIDRLLGCGTDPAEVWGAVMAVAPLVGVPRLIAAIPAITAALDEATA